MSTSEEFTEYYYVVWHKRTDKYIREVTPETMAWTSELKDAMRFSSQEEACSIRYRAINWEAGYMCVAVRVRWRTEDYDEIPAEH